MVSATKIVSFLFWLYSCLIVIRVLLSWFQGASRQRYSSQRAIRLLMRLTEPVLAPLRRIIPAVGGAIDLSPIVALVLLEALRALIVALISRAWPG